MNLKQFIARNILGVMLLFSTPAYAFAQTNLVVPQTVQTSLSSPRQTGSNSAGIKPTIAAKLSSNLQTRADREIQRRITSLNELIAKVGSFKRLSDTQKSSFTTQIQTEITNLTTLSAKIKADTDPAVLKADVQSIVTSFRVYAFYMPQVRILVGANMVLDTSDSLSSLSGKLQTRVTAAKSAGQNTASLETSLADMQVKISEAKTQAEKIIADLSVLTPEGFPENKTTLQAARTNLHSAITSLKAAGKDARQVIQGLMVMRTTESKSSSTSAVPTTPALLGR